MNKITNCLNNKSTIFEDLEASYKIKKKWKIIVGDVLAKSLWFNYIKQDQCVILINHSCWFSEIVLYEKKIIENINNMKIRKKKVERIKLIMENQTNNKKKRQYAVRKNYDNMIGR
ncbi:hypothetical protein CL647_06670 [bacterium]|nr:hypothetical protein [Actinomycetota bacterium]MBE33750.1 hypothetical protein [bacterium]|tara:strand:+ start:4948 stop:5295 length:348 start_codon:yes stop_codon:yes gene_type:complete